MGQLTPVSYTHGVAHQVSHPNNNVRESTMSMRRRKMSSSQSQRVFTSTALRHHKKNSQRTNPMRGGIRL